MRESVITKEAYLNQLAEAAARKIAQKTTPQTIELMIPVWKEIIINEMKPLLELV
jgi:hypothetical protein